MSNKTESQVFYRLIKAGKGHPFPGLYAVEQVCFKGTELVEREIVHEWDLRIISESILAKLGGGSAFKAFSLDNDIGDIDRNPDIKEVEPRTKEELASLSSSKLKQELRLPKKS